MARLLNTEDQRLSDDFGVKITWRFAGPGDIALLAEWNHCLIRDEGSRNLMTVGELTQRMKGWLEREYKAVIFIGEDHSLGYALYRTDSELIYLRQFFIQADQRRLGLGRAGMRILRDEIWAKDVRLTVDVLCWNRAGIEFWLAVGYRDYCLTLEIMP